MSILSIKQELYKFIEEGDDKFIKMLYEKVKAYKDQLQKDIMIAEGEEDIKAGRIHSQQEIKDYIDHWKAS